MKLSVSFLAISDNIKKIKEMDNLNVDYIHYDVMDGIFTPNKSLSYENMKNLNLSKPKDIHLMVSDVKKYVDDFKNLNPEYITFHIETNINHKEMIDYIHSFNIKAGIAINPETSISKIIDILKYVDLVLIMSVHPGKGGQSFIDVSDKIEKLNQLKDENSFVISVDGGVNNETIKKCKDADICVIGSYITNFNMNERVDGLCEDKDLH
jgi:ribulose-phosphate 3-epimerase